MSPRPRRRSSLRLPAGLLLALLGGASWMGAAPPGEAFAADAPGPDLPRPAGIEGAPPSAADPVALDSVVLRGTVRAEGLRPGDVLPGALVEVRQDGRLRTTVSDERGRYRVEDLGSGSARVRVFHLATRPLEVEVRLPGEGELALDLELERRTLTLAGIEVSAEAALGRAAPVRGAGISDGVVAARTRTLDASTGMVEAGLARALSPPPGEEEPVHDRVLFMRGSTVDARTVLLDGAPVLTPFHVAGLVSPFESDLVSDASFYLGGAPSRYEGALSYLFDVETREPRTEGAGGRIALDGILWRGTLESGLPGGGGILFAGRSMHGAQGRVGSREHFPYMYEDLLVRASVPLGAGHRLRLTRFRNEEGVRLDEVLLAGGQARWGNRASSIRYDGRIAGVRVSAVGAESHYHSSLPIAWPEPVLARATSLRERGAVELVVPRRGWRLHLGGSAERTQYGYQLTSRDMHLAGPGSWDPVELQATSAGGYGEVVGSPASRVDVRAGLRGEHFFGSGTVHLAPRGSIRALLTDAAALTFSVGRYHQPVPMPGLMARQLEGEEAALQWNPRLPVASATHLVLALDQDLDEHLNLDVSGFVKMFDRLEGGARGRVRSSGTDLRVAYDSERVGAWVGYALSWFWEEEPGGSSSTFSGRHLVSAGARGTPSDRFEVGLVLGYGAGLPFASVPVNGPDAERTFATEDGRGTSGVRTLGSANAGGAPLDVAPEDDFLRLDLDLRWTVEPTFAGRSTRLRPYIRVMNALDTRDALFQYLDRWREGEIRPVAERPFLPILGVEWRF